MLKPVFGRALLGRVIDRARKVSGDYPIVVATSLEREDDSIEEYAEAEKISVFRGSLDDVATRAVACCDAHGFDRFARICGDRPFLPWELIDEFLEKHEKQGLELATNAAQKSYPAGTMIEIVTVDALKRALTRDFDAADREHVTRYFYRMPAEFKIGNWTSSHPDWAKLSLAIDTPADLQRTEKIMARLGEEPEAARLEQVISCAQRLEN